MQDEPRPSFQQTTLEPRDYTCGYCGREVASALGHAGGGNHRIYICPRCAYPTFFSHYGRQIPGIAAGDRVQHLPADVGQLYEEARQAFSVDAYTASVMASRKVLMNVAVAQGAVAGKTFKEYVDYLAAKGFVPPGGGDWVNHIRDKGNDANHEIPKMTKEDARELLDFLGMLLKFIYEFPARVRPAT
jgi:hypothetical protein